MQEQINENLKKLGTWKRIFFMLIFAAIISLVRMLLWAIILLQVASMLLTGKVNSNVLSFGRSLSAYTYHILLFLTFNADTLPFPFSDWQMTEELNLPEPRNSKK
jgi:ABC-type multidrug transport system fused ATPase/permease subunit